MPGSWLPLLVFTLAILPSVELRTSDGGHQHPPPLITNLRMEPGRRLAWDLNGPAVGVTCKRGNYNMSSSTGTSCVYLTVSECQVTNYTVEVRDPPFSASILYPPPVDDASSGVQNLSCWVHDVDRLSCSWTELGAERGAEHKYQLSWRNGSGPLRPCPAPGPGPRCLFPDVSILPTSFPVLVSAGRGRPCADAVVIPGKEREELRPPPVTGACNASLAVLGWELRSRFTPRLRFQLRLRQESESSAEQVTETDKFSDSSFLLPNPGVFSVQLRAQKPMKAWSPWGPASRFVCEARGPRRGPALVSSLSALGLLGAVLGVWAVCGRCGLARRLCPRVPALKDPLGGAALPTEDPVAPEDLDDVPVTPLHVLAEA